MSNKTIASSVISLLLGTMVTIGSANAAEGDKINKVINVSATIPSGTFSVNPVYGAWPTGIQLPYDAVAKTFSLYSLRLEAIASVGLSASLNSEAKMKNGAEEIPLSIKVDNKVLGSTSTQIIANDAKGTGQTHVVDLTIEAESGTYDTAGLYSGVVDIVFEDNF